MSGLDINRRRNKMVSFRMSEEEILRLNGILKATGMGKADYIIKSILDIDFNIFLGKYESDRLSLELKNLREELIKKEMEISDKQLYLLNEIMKNLNRILARGD